MLKKLLLSMLIGWCSHFQLEAHCQMPCGIYHDEMVFDQIDQFIETTAKAISVMEENPFTSAQDRNNFVRWVMQKEKGADEIAQLITTYFLQQKIKPGAEDTTKRVLSAHQLLFYLVQIKQTVDYKILNDFYEEWEKFKSMFPIEGYKSKVSQEKLKKWVEKRDQKLNSQVKENSNGPAETHSHSHEHDHTHDHHHE